MKRLLSAATLAVLLWASTGANAWWGWPGGWGPWNNGWGNNGWGDDWFGDGWFDFNVRFGVGARGFGHGWNRYDNSYWGYPYGLAPYGALPYGGYPYYPAVPVAPNTATSK